MNSNTEETEGRNPKGGNSKQIKRKSCKVTLPQINADTFVWHYPPPPRNFPWPSGPKSSATCGTRLRFIISFQGPGEQPLHPPLNKSGAESGSDDKLTEDAWTQEGSSSQAPESGHWLFCIIPKRERLGEGTGQPFCTSLRLTRPPACRAPGSGIPG